MTVKILVVDDEPDLQALIVQLHVFADLAPHVVGIKTLQRLALEDE